MNQRKPTFQGEFDTQTPQVKNQAPSVMKHTGNQLTFFEAPFVHYQCGCNRQFVDQEMYVCFNCCKPLCNFCTHQDEIETFYCRFCMEIWSKNEAKHHKYKCCRYIECPICFSVL